MACGGARIKVRVRNVLLHLACNVRARCSEACICWAAQARHGRRTSPILPAYHRPLQVMVRVRARVSVWVQNGVRVSVAWIED